MSSPSFLLGTSIIIGTSIIDVPRRKGRGRVTFWRLAGTNIKTCIQFQKNSKKKMHSIKIFIVTLETDSSNLFNYIYKSNDYTKTWCYRNIVSFETFLNTRQYCTPKILKLFRNCIRFHTVFGREQIVFHTKCTRFVHAKTLLLIGTYKSHTVL